MENEEKKLPSAEDAAAETENHAENVQAEATDTAPETVRISPAEALSDDQYEVSEPMIDGRPVTDEEEEELSGIEISYDLRPDEVKAALKAFQKKTIFKKNIIYTVVLLILAGLYLNTIIHNPDYSVGKVLFVVSLVVIGFLWYMPAHHIRQTVKGVEASTDTFCIEVSEVGFLIKENGQKYLIRYSAPTVSVIELPDVFVALVSREKMFAIPKRCVPAEQMDEVKRLMQEGLKDKYKVQS